MTLRNNGDNGDKKGRILHFTQDHAFFAKQGDIKRAKNDPLNAISRYNEALRLEPKDLDTRLAAAEVLTDMARFNDSDRLVIPYMHLSESFKREAYRIVGFNLLGLNEPEGARSCFNRFFDMTDEVSERTDAILDALDYIDSIDDDEPLLQDAKEAERFRNEDAANDAFDRGDFDRARTVLTKLSEEYPDDIRTLYELALSCLLSFRTEEGEKYVDRLLALDGNNWPGWSLKLMFVRGKNNEIEIKKICKKLETCDSDIPEELFRVNGSLLEAGCAELALGFAKKLVKLLPYDTLSNHRLAVSLARLGQYREAAAVYAKLLKIDRDDYIAKYYMSLCLDHAGKGDPAGGASIRDFSMLQYQLPFDKVIDRVKELLSGNGITPEGITDRWRTDPDLRSTVRWAFSLHEFNINYAMVNLLKIVDEESAEFALRESIADVDAGRSLVNEALGMLKRRGAEEPYFAVLDGSLIEGRVNLVDLSSIAIPKQYKEIFPRFKAAAGSIYSAEVVNAAAGITERYLANLKGVFPKIGSKQSEALSAAVEVLACEQCGVPCSADIAERFSTTHRRITNAVEKIVTAILMSAEPAHGAGPEGENV
ncbi:MAG: tetratricopeptide repeat protein [Clostridia bacterium]|nr:tetratricopeptide repeat protein [Clostridia bacterium]